ncbi:MAG: hypothetical protein F4X35_04380 [Alphaproteobacteria bacterium]|nr:hypothetical protein [Alphaproteobacteria bacterium]
MAGWTYTAFTLDGQSCGHDHYSIDAADRCAHRMTAKLEDQGQDGRAYIMARSLEERHRDGPVCLLGREATEEDRKRLAGLETVTPDPAEELRRELRRPRQPPDDNLKWLLARRLPR